MNGPVAVIELDPRHPVLVAHEDPAAIDTDADPASGWHS